MDWLNYHHLFYFWTVIREGSIAAACRRLLLSPATISAQLRELENALGAKLFKRVGRQLAPTEFGRLAARYAHEIFALGQEFMDVAQGRTLETSLRFRLGVDDVLPKVIVARALEVVFRLPRAVRLSCIEGTQAQLLPQLAVHELDLVLSDAPPDPAIRVRTYSHLLDESGVTLCAAATLARRLRDGFPTSLDGAPALLPTPNASLRRAMDEWFEALGVRPHIVAEFEDQALLNACGHGGAGFFAVPDGVARALTAGRGVKAIGPLGTVRAQLYAISVDRQVRHPAAIALVENAGPFLRGTRASGAGSAPKRSRPERAHPATGRVRPRGQRSP